MPAIVGSIPDREVAPLMAYIGKAREQVGDRLTYNELLLCLLVARLEER